MKGFKKTLAALLAAVLLLGALPAAALEELQETIETPPVEASPEVLPEAETQAALSLEDAVVYNLADYNTAVLPASMEEALEDEEVYDAVGAFMMDTPCADLLFFDADGDFTIRLPDAEPFFPYQVQFQYEGETWTEWFETEEDTVDVGGHTFSLALKEGTSASYVDGPEDEVRTYLAKDFTTTGDPAATISLQPMTTNITYIYKLPEELHSVRLGDLTNTEVADDITVAWAVRSDTPNDRFQVGKTGDVVDLLATAEKLGFNSGSFQIELIVGGGNQFTRDATRYVVNTNLSSRLLVVGAYASATATDALSTRENTTSTSDRSQQYYTMYLPDSTWTPGANIYLRIKPSSTLNYIASSGEGRTFEYAVYEGFYPTKAEFEAATGLVDVTGTIWGDDASGYPVKIPEATRFNWDGLPKFTFVLKENDSVAQVLAFGVRLSRDSASIYPNYYLTDTPDTDNYSNRVANQNGYEWDEQDLTNIYLYEMYQGKALDASYYFRMQLNDPDNRDATYYVASATANGQSVDVATLFSTGYRANFSKEPVTFVINYTQNFRNSPGGFMRLKVKTVEAPEIEYNPSDNTIFNIYGANPPEGSDSLESYVMKGEDDGYYQYGYQTVFLRSSQGAVPSTIYPVFSTATGANVYRNEEFTTGTQQTSGKTPLDFTSGQPYQYSVQAENEKSYRNYWVTFLTKQAGGPKLFVNGASNIAEGHKVNDEITRLVLFDDAKSVHDLFLANIGDQEMKNLYVKLEDASNVKLDDYWTIKEGDALRPFPDSFYRFNSSYNELQNMAKLRLTPIVDADTGTIQGGPISGTLIIGYDNKDGNAEEIKIKLVGAAGDLNLTNANLRLGVKWVPYATAIQNNIMIDASSYQYEIIDGTLPAGITLTGAGELYGITSEVGRFPFTLRVAHTGTENYLATARALGFTQEELTALERRLSFEGELTLRILDNTDSNVINVPMDQTYGYEILKFIGAQTTPDHYVIYNYSDLEFQSEGPFEQFANFYLDGQLVAQAGYDVRNGSTIITVHEQTFRSAGTGKHTIAAEFFTNKDRVSTMRTSAQNYYVEVKGSSSGSSGGGGGGSSRPSTTTKPTAPTTPTPAAPTLPFADIPATHTFFEDILWVYNNGLMIGTTDTTFAPANSLTSGAIVTVLARMAKVDLTQYEGVRDEEIDPSLWFAPAAIWAKQSDLLPEEGAAIFQGPLSRQQMAVMLVKYLKLQGVEPQVPAEPVGFADADQMSPAGNEAFQVLYHYGIFKGTGSGAMDPSGTTNRGQFAALIHRTSEIISASAEADAKQ